MQPAAPSFSCQFFRPPPSWPTFTKLRSNTAASVPQVTLLKRLERVVDYQSTSSAKHEPTCTPGQLQRPTLSTFTKLFQGQLHAENSKLSKPHTTCTCWHNSLLPLLQLRCFQCRWPLAVSTCTVGHTLSKLPLNMLAAQWVFTHWQPPKESRQVHAPGIVLQMINNVLLCFSTHEPFACRACGKWAGLSRPNSLSISVAKSCTWTVGIQVEVYWRW
jgi:hypothetical protein